MKNLTKSYSYFLAFLLLSFPYLAEAQMEDSRIGVKAGANLSNFYASEIDAQNASLGFHVGIFTELAVGEYFSIQPEILLSTKGNEVTYGDDSGIADFVNAEGEAEFNLTYLDVPVLAKITAGEVFNVHIGPYVSYLLGASVDTDGTFDTEVTEVDRSRFNKLDYGLVAGIGVDLQAVSIGLRYNLGLNQVADATISETLLQDSKNSVAQLYIAVGL